VLRDARERYDVPVVEVIQPAVRRAVAATRNHRVGVIATQGTVTSRAYEDAFAAAPALTLTTQACPRFVEFVENGVVSGEEVVAEAEKYLAPVREAGVDTLVLGCTHYPRPAAPASYLWGRAVTLVPAGGGRARAGTRLLRGTAERRGDPRPPRHVFPQTAEAGGSENFARLSRRFLGP